MTQQPLDSRVESLETRVTDIEANIGPSDRSPEQILPLRAEMRNGFSALDTRMTSIEGKVDKLADDVTEVKTHMRVLHEDVIGRLKLIQEGVPKRPDRSDV